MDAGDLRVFEAVARLGGMNRAAEELHTVQSNVTGRIRALEQELGVPLFDRHARGVVCTAAARRLLPYAHRVAALLHDARRAARDDGEPSGPLVIGSLETTAAIRLSPLLAGYAAAYPHVDLSLRTGTTGELIQDVLARRVEGAFVCGPVDHPDLAAESRFQEELAVLTAPTVTDPDAIISGGDFRIVVLKAGCSYRLRLEAYLARRGATGIRILEFGTLEAILACVGAGLGITLLPRALAETVRRAGQVAVHPLPTGEAMVETVFLRRRDGYVSKALAAFIAMTAPGETGPADRFASAAE
ncbi:LysR family transcriptional regulator [Rhodopila sp.]|jgi:DNA-binding transcriptional LysR family regulator|uniref:LysR family transcriptional regulator n=1 Tax=Rhodopila sp. TaxID=2480087 RepID=UPI002C367A7B|nr:LysR substrate-binding domain-containing protein [Rhodopila sp.]HVZ09750.1 LysR substrate-binding domain-containing protein [Rhodopila sp.]